MDTDHDKYENCEVHFAKMRKLATIPEYRARVAYEKHLENVSEYFCKPFLNANILDNTAGEVHDLKYFWKPMLNAKLIRSLVDDVHELKKDILKLYAFVEELKNKKDKT